jgi:hypothetical protein
MGRSGSKPASMRPTATVVLWLMLFIARICYSKKKGVVKIVVTFKERGLDQRA